MQSKKQLNNPTNKPRQSFFKYKGSINSGLFFKINQIKNTMIKLQIKNRFTGSIIFEYEKENNTISETVKEFIREELKTKSKANLSKADLRWANLSKADLRWADLRWANLSEADLRWANLSEADLSEANLRWANLSEADLSKADLRWANLSEADLSEANLRWADLSEANLSKADLRWADLSEADLSEANLSKANLEIIRNDFWAKLLILKKEIPAFKEKLISGKIDGSVYEGECCCLVGTMAKIKDCHYTQLPGVPNSPSSPAERWFLGIKENDTPENSQVSKITLEWIEEFEMHLNK